MSHVTKRRRLSKVGGRGKGDSANTLPHCLSSAATAILVIVVRAKTKAYLA